MFVQASSINNETAIQYVTAKYFVGKLKFSRNGDLVIFEYTGNVTGESESIPNGDMGYIVAAGGVPTKMRPSSDISIYPINPITGIGLTLKTDGSVKAYNYTGASITNIRANRFPNTPYFV